MRVRPSVQVILAAVLAAAMATVTIAVAHAAIVRHSDRQAAKAVTDMRRSMDRLYASHGPVVEGCRAGRPSFCADVPGEPEDVSGRLNAALDDAGRFSQSGCDRFRPEVHSGSWQSCVVQGRMDGEDVVVRTATGPSTSVPGSAASPSPVTAVSVVAASSS